MTSQSSTNHRRLLGGGVAGLLELLFVLGHGLRVDLRLWGEEGRHRCELQVLLPVEGDGFGLHFAVFDVDLVSHNDDWDVFANTNQISVPVGNVFVSDTGGHVEHKNGALTLNVVAVPESSKLFLASSVPDVELDLTSVGLEHDRVDLNSEGGNVLLLKLSCQVALHKCGFTYTTIAYKNQFINVISHFL